MATSIPWLNLLDFMQLSDKADASAPLARACAEASKSKGRTVFLPAGSYSLQTPVSIPDGIMLQGEGSCGASDRGTILVGHFDTVDPFRACLQWDGSYPGGFQGTGGGISNICMKKANGHKGGTAIVLHAIDDAHRPGWWQADRLLITVDHFAGRQPSWWNFGIYVDGINCVTPGAAGIRDLQFENVNIFGCSNECLTLLNAVHVVANGLQIGAADNPNRQRVIVGGGPTLNEQSTSVFLYGLDLWGTIRVENTRLFRLDGFASVLELAPSAKRGLVTMAFDDCNVPSPMRADLQIQRF